MSIEALLEKHGALLLGVAHTAFAFADPLDGREVIKIGFDPDDGWPAWADWCRGQTSPHVPLVRSVQWFHVGRRRVMFAANVERLFPTDFAKPFLRADKATIKRDPLLLAELVEHDSPSIAAMLREAAAAFPTARWDMGPQNWLARADGTVVLNDPMSAASTTH